MGIQMRHDTAKYIYFFPMNYTKYCIHFYCVILSLNIIHTMGEWLAHYLRFTNSLILLRHHNFRN